MVFEPPIDPVLCDIGDQPITFMSNETYITLNKEKLLGQKPSLSLRFTTVEPDGLLLFSGRRDMEYFALEVYDRKLWMVTDAGYGPVRRQVS